MDNDINLASSKADGSWGPPTSWLGQAILVGMSRSEYGLGPPWAMNEHNLLHASGPALFYGDRSSGCSCKPSGLL